MYLLKRKIWSRMKLQRRKLAANLSEIRSPYNFYHTQVIMRSFHFDRAAPVEHFSHRRSGARHRIRANSTVVFYEPFECPAWAFFHRPLIFLATVLLFTVDYGLQCVSCFDKGRICTLYIRYSEVLFSLYIGRCGTRLLFVTITRMNGGSFYCRYFVCNPWESRLCIASTRERSRIKVEFNTPTGILEWFKIGSLLGSRNSLPITRS